MTATGSMNCGVCGRDRRSDDRFCGGCGSSFTGGVGGRSSEASLDHFVSLGDPGETGGSRRRGRAPAGATPGSAAESDGRRAGLGLVAGVVAAVLAVIIGVSLLGGGDSDPDDTAAEDADVTAELDDDGETDADDPGTADDAADDPGTADDGMGDGAGDEAEGSTGFAGSTTADDDESTFEPTPTPSTPINDPVVIRNDGSDIGAELAKLGLDGWLIAIVDNRPLIWSLETGAELTPSWAADVNTSFAVMNEEGVICCGLYRRQARVGFFEYRWDDSDPRPIEVLDRESHPAMFIEDPDVGRVIISGGSPFPVGNGPDAEPDLSMTAIRLDTLETKSIEVDEFVLLRSPIGGGYGLPTVLRPSLLQVNAGGRVFDWTWNEGWTDAGEGATLYWGWLGGVMVEECDTPTSCTRSLRTPDGDLPAEALADGKIPSSGVRSPNGRWAFMEFNPTGAFGPMSEAVRIYDEVTGDRFEITDIFDEFRTGFETLEWVGDSHLLFANDRQAPVLVHIGTGETTVLEFLRRTAGQQPQLLWFPELDGVDPAAIG